MAAVEQPLSGDKALELFISSEPFPLHKWLEEWQEGKFKANSGYIIAVVNAYYNMRRKHHGDRKSYRPRRESCSPYTQVLRDGRPYCTGCNQFMDD